MAAALAPAEPAQQPNAMAFLLFLIGWYLHSHLLLCRGIHLQEGEVSARDNACLRGGNVRRRRRCQGWQPDTEPPARGLPVGARPPRKPSAPRRRRLLQQRRQSCVRAARLTGRRLRAGRDRGQSCAQGSMLLGEVEEQ